MNKIFEGVAGNSPALNRFDLSYTNTFSAKIGLLYPIQCDEVTPGDVFKMSAFCHCEVQPLVAPLMSDLTIYAHTFFVPYRLLYGVDGSDGTPIWEKFITGGKDGSYETALTSWAPSWTKTTFSSETIWDCIGNPVSYTKVDDVYTWAPIVPSGINVSIAPKYAYNFIYNTFYRDENLIEEVANSNEDLLKASFKKDYFTSALEMQQRGTSPAIPITGTIPVTITGTGFTPLKANEQISASDISNSSFGYSGAPNVGLNYKINGSWYGSNGGSVTPAELYSPVGVNVSGLSGTAVATGTLSSVNINQLRLMFAQQRLLELNMRAGYRYTEFLGAHYGVNPTDARLDRPEYIGGCMVPISVSPMVQTSGTQSDSGTQLTPQGNKSGIANANSIQKIGNYRVLEHGLIMTILSVRPKPIYQQGINRQWLRQSRYDYYFPEFAYLSEQGIYNAELYVQHNSSVSTGDPGIFGYQAHWNEMRCKNNMVSGALREQFDYWTMARKFGSKPALNQDFIEIEDSDFNRCFAVQDEDEFIISWSNLIDAYRPLPAMGVPGLVDHVYGGR